jgi:hypothetical protein
MEPTGIQPVTALLAKSEPRQATAGGVGSKQTNTRIQTGPADLDVGQIRGC